LVRALSWATEYQQKGDNLIIHQAERTLSATKDEEKTREYFSSNNAFKNNVESGSSLWHLNDAFYCKILGFYLLGRQVSSSAKKQLPLF